MPPQINFEPIIEEIKNAPNSITVFGKLKKTYPRGFFLDSSNNDRRLGRFSFVGCDPFLIFKSKRDSISLEWKDEKPREEFKANPFFALKNIIRSYNQTRNSLKLPFVSGGVGYFAYDMKDFIEKLPDIAKDDLGLPECVFGFHDVVIIYDNLKKTAYIASSGLPEIAPEARAKKAQERLEEFKEIVSSASPNIRSYALTSKMDILKPNISKSSYIESVKKAKDYIRKGDIYQVNLSQRFEADLNMDTFELYGRLRRFSAAPFSSYLDFDDVAVLSSSPERFLLKRGDYIETRPIKGTRPRGEDPYDDSRLEGELLASQKDRAEHIMIVDLERNDLGRICKYGSVWPSELMSLEKYSTVFHLVSTVSGRLRKNVGPMDCLLATFPGGSITGAPKIRAMEIIEELEPAKRSIYTGSIGYISFDGNMDTSIVIRTFVVKGKKVYFQVGGGIIADSDPEKEYEETIDKARGLMRALGVEEDVRVKLEARI